MAIIDKKSNQYKIDRDDSVFIGLKLPLVLDNGELASTKQTLEAVKQNLFNLCSTELGERVYQPGLGIQLKKFLFEPFSEDTVNSIQETIVSSIDYWLPYLKLNNIEVKMYDNGAGDYRNRMLISVHFSLKRDPNTHESIQITVDGE